jgi:hypothetical protein
VISAADVDLIAQTAHWAVPYGRAARDRWSAHTPPIWQLIVSTGTAAGTLTVTIRPRHPEPVIIETPGRRRSLTDAHLLGLTVGTWRNLLDAAAHEARLARSAELGKSTS